MALRRRTCQRAHSQFQFKSFPVSFRYSQKEKLGNFVKLRFSVTPFCSHNQMYRCHPPYSNFFLCCSLSLFLCMTSAQWAMWTWKSVIGLLVIALLKIYRPYHALRYEFRPYTYPIHTMAPHTKQWKEAKGIEVMYNFRSDVLFFIFLLNRLIYSEYTYIQQCAQHCGILFHPK